MMPEASDYSEEIGDLGDSSSASIVLGGESLREFVTFVLTAGLKVEKIVYTNTAITSNAIERDFAAIEELVEVGPAHPEPLCGLIRASGIIKADGSKLCSATHATSDVDQDIAQLSASVLGISVQSSELLSGDVGGVNDLHVSHP
jgi:hypothetical protein